MKKALLSLALAAIGAIGVNAQVVTTSPSPLFRTSENIVLTYHPADAASNKTLANLPESTELYAHIGVITTASKNDDDWKHAPTWGKNDAKHKLTYKAANTYELAIGDLKSYFNLTASEQVTKIAIVFRTADSKKEGKTSTGGNIMVDVLPEGVSFTSDYAGSTACVGTAVNFSVISSDPATITLSANGTQIASKANATSLDHTYTFNREGECVITAKATKADGTSTEQSKTFTVFPAPNMAEYPGGTPKMGAVANADGSVTFCLAAPLKQRVQIVGAWDNYELKDERVMNCHNYQGNNYFWITIPGLDPDTKYPYYYIVDGDIRVGDPYAKLILDRTNDTALRALWASWGTPLPSYPSGLTNPKQVAVYWGNINKYEWSEFEIPDHRNLVIYEMLFRDFTGTEGEAKGNGSVRQAIEKIPYLKALGVNAVELMPIMEFSGNNSWGYNTNYYFAPDKAYGAPDDYKEFIDLCHQNGMAVILDIVFNQSDGLHPWYQMYDKESNPFYNAEAPHDYSVLNDWRQENPIVRQQWEDCLKYWLTEYNVDGFRFDLVKGLGDSDSYGAGTEGTNASRIANMKRLHAVITSVKPNGIHINEFLGGATEETRYGNDGQLVWAKFSDASYKFAQGTGTGDMRSFDTNNHKRGQWGAGVAYFESHDEERAGFLAGKYGHANVKNSEEAICNRLGSLAAIMLMSPGPKMIWQFGELCADQTTKNGNSNNLSPKTVIWDNLNNDNKRHVHDIYATLCNLRKENPEMFSEEAESKLSNLNAGAPLSSGRIMKLTLGNKEIITFINADVQGDAKSIDTAADVLSASNCQLICASKGINPVLTNTGDGRVGTSLPAHTFAVFATANVSGIEDIVSDSAAPVAKAFGGDGEIVIVGEYTHAEAYNIQGVRMGSLNGLAKGIYIVNVDGAVAKVAVR